ncbi:hypothetical protein BCV70DRAFT_198444 [Testicularia cyperi]|uniref:Uncharacterized protein n=1 Tax=Testicularia cyperi TaxID=1882483 RepID=A0A317XY03_9BASI|nr:hypothetical protein BCV70DRAFT_198444 [Testicularia cyperi]
MSSPSTTTSAPPLAAASSDSTHAPGGAGLGISAHPSTTIKAPELTQDTAMQIHRILAKASPPPHGPFGSTSEDQLSNWYSRQSLESQIDDLLSHAAQPLSLAAIDKVQAQLRHEMRSCEDRIDQMVAELETETDPERMSHVQQSIAALLEQLHLIREKARESENVVREITRDIRSLDIAKRNVMASMTALKRLQMLVNGVDQLERLAETRRYREAASSLQAVRSLLDFFQSYRGVERIAAAWRQVGELQMQLRTVVMKDYEQFFLHDPGRSVRSTNLPESALVIDAIGAEARSALIEWYCSLQLREYRRIFRATDEAGQLDNVSRRFAWFRRVLKTHEDEHAAAFLSDWKVERWLIRRFADITKEDLRSVLIREQSRLNVATLMEALNSTLEFEAAMSRKYGTTFEQLISTTLQQDESKGSQNHAQHPQLMRSSSTAGSGTSTPPAPSSIGQQPSPRPAVVPTLSSIFDPYLTVFVEAQDRALSEMFVQYRRQGARLSHDGGASDAPHGGAGSGGFGADGIFGGGGNATGGDMASSAAAGDGGTGGTTVLPSSTEMFYFYRQTLEQCARLSNREPFRDLCEVYKKWLRVYAEDVLRAALVPSGASRRSIDVRPNVVDVQKWCLVLNTADYCATTAAQLEDKLREKIHPDFRDRVGLDDEKEIFVTLISFSVQTLARELELCSEPIWNTMLRPAVPWSSLQQVHESVKSQYMVDLSSLLEQVGVVVRQDVENKRYVRSWCDKVVAMLAARFLNALVRLRPIAPLVAQQLLIDATELKKMLLELPRYPIEDLGGSVNGVSDASLSHWMPTPTAQQTAVSTAAASYVRYVNRLTERIDILLRLVLAPTDADGSVGTRNDDLVHTYIRLVRDRSFSNFQKVLDLKGVRKVDQNGLLDRFVQATSGGGSSDAMTDAGAAVHGTERRSAEANGGIASDLADQSFLTQLDMDPSPHPVLLQPFNPSQPSFLDAANRRPSTNLATNRSNSLFGPSASSASGPDSPRSGTPGQGYAADPTATTGAGRAFSDLRKFGNFFGAALGRREDTGRGR